MKASDASRVAVLAGQVSELVTENQNLKRRIEALEQTCSDLDIALVTSVEHGDMIESSLHASNTKLHAEVRDRIVAERRLACVLVAVWQQKTDLELLVATITEHGDEIDSQWLRRYAAAETLSRVDPLTGLANRREIDERLDQEWRRCARARRPLALVMADIDHFKGYNDAYGHAAGDLALRRVAEELKRVCRRTGDVVGRMGGEEFLLLLPETDLAGAGNIAEALRQAVWDAGIPYAEGRVTLSMGVAAAVPQSEGDWADLLSIADNLLYIAKRDGRNTIKMPDEV